jgi:hypothetical protein
VNNVQQVDHGAKPPQTGAILNSSVSRAFLLNAPVSWNSDPSRNSE